jgi:hypothetical protein
MLQNKRNVFWEALLMTVAIFIIGMMIGVSFEKNKINEINNYYSESDAVLMDILALQKITELGMLDCSLAAKANLDFADRVYAEADLMSQYDTTQKISDGMDVAHKKYDLLRTFLWINSMKSRQNCQNDFSVVVYLYEYKTEDLSQKAEQEVWSNVLVDLKEQKGGSVILIPIAVDTNVTSLGIMIDKFNITKYPAVIVNDKNIIYDLNSVNDLEKYLTD